MPAAVIAFATSIAAAALIFHSWRRGQLAWAALAGWLAAFASAFTWSRVLGVEFGVVYAIMVFVCLVWVAVALMVEAPKAAAEAPRPFQALRGPAIQDGVKHGLRFLLSVPAAGVLAMMLCVALALYLPWTMPAKFALAIFLYPVLWGALSVWICAQADVLRPALVSLGLFVFSSLLLFL